ncbi:hypothetical protein [Streptomyces sp. MRC013]|nr:hypothetical protein [Streptomyces sp. MRC013]
MFHDDEEGAAVTIAPHDNVSGPDPISPRLRADLIAMVREDY